MLLLEQSTTTTSRSFGSCCSPTCWKPKSVPTWHLTSCPGRGAKLVWYHPEGCNFPRLMGQEHLLANSSGSYVACYIFINSSDVSPLLIAMSPICGGDNWKATVGSEVWASSGLSLRLPCPKDQKNKKCPPYPLQNSGHLQWMDAQWWEVIGYSVMGGHWYVPSSFCRNQQVHRKISQDGLKPPRNKHNLLECWSSSGPWVVSWQQRQAVKLRKSMTKET